MDKHAQARIALRDDAIRRDNAQFLPALRRRGFTEKDLDQLAEAAIRAWGRASGKAREVIFSVNKVEYRSRLSTFFVKIFTLGNEHILNVLTPDVWPEVPGKSGTHTARQALSQALRFAIFKRDNYRCQLCGRARQDDPYISLEVDHRIAVAQGGTDDEENLWTLCRDCNGGKSDQPL